MSTITVDGKGFMKDGKGRLVPVESVSDYDKLKDQTVETLVDKALSMQQSITDFKLSGQADVLAFMNIAYEQYDAKPGGEKGNVSISNFEDTRKVQIAVGRTIDFDERLKVAKSLIDECLNNWSEDAPTELKTIVLQAFEVDKEGKASPARILPLLKFDFDDETWMRGMQALKDSLSVQYSKKYIRFYQRAGTEGKWEAISLDIAKL